MALRDQPYLPLYVQDFLTDEKLNECSAEAHGIYIKIMCLMHKSETYGKILLEQKYKQNDKPLVNFAHKFARHTPFAFEEILSGLNELSSFGVIEYNENELWQKRMIRDNEISELRAEAGSKGGKITQYAKAKYKASDEAKDQANTENENENENENIINNKNRYLEIFDSFRKKFPGVKRGNKTEFENFKKKHKDWCEILPTLNDVLSNQIMLREQKKLNKEFVPEWKNLQTWINQRCWEEEFTKALSISDQINNLKA